jgi:DNA-binding CsgD family transcriptional regulator
MNPVAEEIMSYYGYAESLQNEDVLHIGVKRRSGRYPYGSGDEPYQHGMDFLGRYEALKKSGKSDKDIAKELNMLNEKGEPSTGILRLELKYANDMRKIDRMQTAKRLKEKEGLGATEIGRRMGINESTVRSLLDPAAQARAELAANTANFLRDQCDKKGMIDVGVNVERELSGMDLSSYNICKDLNISKDRLSEALYILQKEGYEVYSGRFDQVNNAGKMTTQKVLCPPGTPHKDIYNLDQIHTISDYTSHDGGNTFTKFQYPASLDSKRLKVLLGDEIGPDGERGVDKDGIIQIRPGVKDLSLGDAKYSQVRILVDGDKYLKGMAVYSDNMPDGIDVIFNSNKSSVEKALKAIKTDDPMNPFGSLIKPGGQSYYDDPNGKFTDPITGKKQSLSLINKRADEGDWTDWTDALPSQFLSKQSVTMAKKQLNLAKADKLAEYDEICSLTNPTIKKHLLEKFADSCDSAAVHLKAAALPGQKYHVIIPVNTLKDTEIYAPKYKDGTKLALIRYPHAGTFEIPILTVNNKHAAAKKLLGSDTEDAVGINKKIADRLSGADFDGDTVMCIPTHDRQGRVKITSTKPLKDLEGFDPQMEYPERPGMKYMKDPVTGKDATQTEMGKISNLIADMTLFGAPPEEMARAVKHSMVVIDAGKHKLDYKRSEADNNIAELKRKWQQHVKEDGTTKYGGAATIISKSSGEATVDKRQGTPKVNLKGKEWYDPSRPEGSLIYKNADDLYYPDRTYNKETGLTTIRTTSGKKITYDAKDPAARDMYEPVQRVNSETGEVTYTNKTGDVTYRYKTRTQPSTRMAETDDAMSLVSPAKHPMELAYAEYANSMKSLANRARKEMMTTGEIAYDATAKRTYQKEVDSLMDKLNTAQLNSVRERAAQRKANVEVQAAIEANPNIKRGDLKKVGQRALSTARNDMGSVARRDRSIQIDDREWEAIQAGAISKTQLKKILNNTDVDVLREKATPRTTKTLSDAKVNRIKAMSATYTIGEIAEKFNISPATVSKYLKGVS